MSCPSQNPPIRVPAYDVYQVRSDFNGAYYQEAFDQKFRRPAIAQQVAQKVKGENIDAHQAQVIEAATGVGGEDCHPKLDQQENHDRQVQGTPGQALSAAEAIAQPEDKDGEEQQVRDEMQSET
jgi:hypothetical protein